MCALGVWRGLAEGLFLAADRSQRWKGRPGNLSRDTQQHFTPAVGGLSVTPDAWASDDGKTENDRHPMENSCSADIPSDPQ